MAESLKLEPSPRVPCPPCPPLLAPTSFCYSSRHVTREHSICLQHRHSSGHPLPPSQGFCSGKPNEREEDEAENTLLAQPLGQHTAARFILHRLCLHTAVNMFPISLPNSSYKLYDGRVRLLSSHKRFGGNY